MTFPVKSILLGAAAVIAFDLVASVASRRVGFAYSNASIGSCLIYLAVGLLAARSATAAPVQTAGIATGIVGLVDASIGWAISWKVGPGRLPDGAQLTIGRWIATALFVVLLSAALGALGGFGGRGAASTTANA